MYTLSNKALLSNATITVVGCGGTGGFVAEGVSRLLLSYPGMNLVLIDHDQVEQHNLIRQNFYQEDLGKFKAQALAERLARKFNRSVGYFVNPFNPKFVQPGLIIGCVDNGPARAAIAKAMSPWNGSWYLDAGNSDNWGQVLIGNEDVMEKCAFDPEKGLCYALPLPTIQQPGLLAGQPQPALSCAEAVAQNHQSPVINQAMAMLVLEVVRKLLAGTLSWMQVYISLDAGTMHAVEATPEVVARMTGMRVSSLIKKGGDS